MADGILNAPLQARAALTAGRDMWSTQAIDLAHVPSVKMSDGPMGIASGRVDERDVSLLTPCGLLLGASWDATLVSRVGALIGQEARRRRVDMVLAPNLNLPRSPLAGRAFELFSEDPLLIGTLGVAWIKGLQSQGVGAVAKHLVCNDSETQRDSMNAIVDWRALREVYLLPFEMAAEAGCAGLLMAYNSLNGLPCVEHRDLMMQIAKAEWGFSGFLVSDWFGTRDTLRSAQAGLDLEMPGPARFFGQKFLAAVESGSVSQERMTDASLRVAQAARRFGAKSDPAAPSSSDRELLVEAAAAGFVLLKNDNALLPLQPNRCKRLAVIGPNALAPCYQGGTFAKIAVDPNTLRPIDAIRKRFEGACEVLYEPGVLPSPRLPPMPVVPALDLHDGAVGMTVEYFGSHDFEAWPPVRQETRNTNSLTWFAGLPDMPAVFDQPAGIRARGRYTAETAGPHEFFVGATGSVRLLIDGTEMLARDPEIAARDVMGVLKSGDAECVTQELRVGQTVDVVVEFRYQPARAHGLWYGIRGPDHSRELLERAVSLASSADAVVLIVGETADASVESKDRKDTRLTAEQIALIRRIGAANRNTVVVANVGHAFDTAWDKTVSALLMTWYSGEQFATALAEVLAGDREPGGRMPVTIAARDADYPAFDLTPDDKGDLRYSESWHIGYRDFCMRGVAPRYGLGAGFGYAKFAMSTASFEPHNATVIVDVSNESNRAGKEVVQVYALDPETQVPILAGFTAIVLAGGAQRRIRIALSPSSLRRWDADHDRWQPAASRYTLWVGRSVGDPQMQVLRDVELLTA
jgi:beta-glucosidase